MDRIQNKLTIDLEEWFHPYFYRGIIPIHKWDKSLSRAIYQSDLILELLKERDIKSTFFIVGWIADNFPEIINKIHTSGHQIGIHSYYHSPVYNLSPNDFEIDLVKSIESIYRVIGVYPNIYRAPNFSIRKDTLWAINILKKNGISEDSSIHLPLYHPDYSNSLKIFPDDFHKVGINEHPITTLNYGSINIPFAGGAYFRFYPYSIINRIWDNINNKGKSVTFYIHPWELDNDLPKTNLNKIAYFRTRFNLSNNLSKFELLLNMYKFGPLIK